MFRLAMIAVLAPVLIHALTAEDIIRQVDQNQVFETQKGRAVMVIDRDGRKMTKEMVSYGMKEGSRFFVEFLNPEDKGVKYLKIKNELWIYLPDADDIMKISGHMLRQGMMGSDLSYEDMLSDEELEKKYRAELKGEQIVDGVSCYNIELTAKVEDVTYYRQRMLVDKTRMVPLEYDLYAKSGRLLKRFSQSGIRKFGDRYFPTKIEIRDMKRKDSVTRLEYFDLEFDKPLPARLFTRQNLRK